MGWGTGNIGGGGAALNFDVKQYTTESKLSAAKPKENTIGVITTTAITSWYFAAEQPGNMVNGDVWFPTGTSSTVAFNALKKNAVQVYPLSAKQMVSGALVDKVAKSYQGGKWVDCITKLVIFEAGKGAVQEYATKKGTIDPDATITVSTSKISVNGTDIVYYTKNKINTAGFKTLRLVGKFTKIDKDNDYTGFGLMSSVPIADNFEVQKWVSSKEIESPSSSSKTYDCPISGGGSYYFVFACAMCVGEITDIRLIQ